MVNSASRERWHLQEVTGTELMGTCPTTAEKTLLEPQVGMSLPCPNASIRPDLKSGSSKNREKPASLELCFCVRSMQAGLEITEVLTKH